MCACNRRERQRPRRRCPAVHSFGCVKTLGNGKAGGVRLARAPPPNDVTITMRRPCCTHLSSGHKEKDVKARFQEVEGPSRTKNRCVQSISALSLNASMYVVHAHCGPATLDCAHPLLHLRAVTTAGRMARRCSSGTRGAPRRCRRSCAWTPTLLPTRSIRSGRFCAAPQHTACGDRLR